MPPHANDAFKVQHHQHVLAVGTWHADLQLCPNAAVVIAPKKHAAQSPLTAVLLLSAIAL